MTVSFGLGSTELGSVSFELLLSTRYQLLFQLNLTLLSLFQLSTQRIGSSSMCIISTLQLTPLAFPRRRYSEMFFELALQLNYLCLNALQMDRQGISSSQLRVVRSFPLLSFLLDRSQLGLKLLRTLRMSIQLNVQVVGTGKLRIVRGLPLIPFG